MRVNPKGGSASEPGLRKASAAGEPLPEDPDGMFSKAEEGRRGSEGARRASSASEAPHLTKQAYTSAFGDDADAAVANQEKSRHKGKFRERRERVFSALENFINEVTPANQTELNTRAAPFAQFIARMHRQIHEKWAFGFLTQMDTSFRDSPMNDLNLIAKLEIVLDGAGDIDKIAMVRTSGITGFAAAAVSAVYEAAPFPTPLPAIFQAMARSTSTGNFTATATPASPPASATSSWTTVTTSAKAATNRPRGPRMPAAPRHGHAVRCNAVRVKEES